MRRRDLLLRLAAVAAAPLLPLPGSARLATGGWIDPPTWQDFVDGEKRLHVAYPVRKLSYSLPVSNDLIAQAEEDFEAIMGMSRDEFDLRMAEAAREYRTGNAL